MCFEVSVFRHVILISGPRETQLHHTNKHWNVYTTADLQSQYGAWHQNTWAFLHFKAVRYIFLIEVTAAPYKTSDKNSFAYVSARERWVYIIVSISFGLLCSGLMKDQTGIINDVGQPYLLSVSVEAKTESQSIVTNLVKLRSEIQRNQRLM